jgi:glycyl-tRNA synthetase beta chain
VFIEGLGTIGEKSRRVQRVAHAISRRLGEADTPDDALVSRAARLAKADLASEMIKDGKEFTRLQGVIGAHYARESREDNRVVAAIREHYRPRTPADAPPRSVLGAVIGVADRMDTICGCFVAGFKPTGSQDPYGLRRSANGLIRIIEGRPGVRLDEAIDEAFAAYRESGVAGDLGAARGEVIEFMKGRAEGYLRENGVPYDVANAMVPVSWTRPGEALRRGREIARLRGDAVFERLITGVKRVGNILPPESRSLGVGWDAIRSAALEGGELRPGVSYSREAFEDEAERGLAEALGDALPKLESAESGERFREVLEGLSALADPIDLYFDRVLVNCEDRAVRANRLAFLSVVYAVFGRYADFSRIVEEGNG